MLSPKEKLIAARERSAKSPTEVAIASDVSASNYYDLEAYDDEVYTAISVAELRRICRVLEIKVIDLFDSPTTYRTLTLESLADTLREFLRKNDCSFADFEEKVGWEVGNFLANPEVAQNWNIECFKDVCGELEIDWLSVAAGLG